jgi:molecular chaperone GrpE
MAIGGKVVRVAIAACHIMGDHNIRFDAPDQGNQAPSCLGRLGLVTYGEKGDPFDPKIHEALTYTDSPDVAEDTCVEIIFPGYKVGDRILRPAKVAVAAPATGPDGASNEVEWPDAEEGN